MQVRAKETESKGHLSKGPVGDCGIQGAGLMSVRQAEQGEGSVDAMGKWILRQEAPSARISSALEVFWRGPASSLKAGGGRKFPFGGTSAHFCLPGPST